MLEDIFAVGVPAEELEAPSGFTPPPSGLYRTTLQAGTEIVSGSKNPDWRGLKPNFLGLQSVDEDHNETDTFVDAAYEMGRTSFTLANPNSAKAVQIGYGQAVGLCVALGIAVEDANGNFRLPIDNNSDEALADLAQQIDAMAGTPVVVYVGTGPRRARPDGSHLKENGEPWIDSEVKRVEALK